MADEDGAGGQGGGNLGDVLVRNDMVSEDELEEAKAEAAKGGAGLTGALARLGYVKETQLVEFLSRQYGVPSINLEEVEVEEDVIEMIPQDVAERHGIIPIDKHGSTIVVAMTDPSNIYAMDDIKFLTGFDVEAVVTSEASIESALERYYGGSSGEEIFDDVDVDEVDFMSEGAADLDLDNLALDDLRLLLDADPDGAAERLRERLRLAHLQGEDFRGRQHSERRVGTLGAKDEEEGGRVVSVRAPA